MRAGINPEVVVEKAAALANRDGLEALTLAALAVELGVKTPSLYNHVGGLGDLRRKLGLLGACKLKDRLTDAAIGCSGEDALVDVGIAYVEFVRKEPGLYEAMGKAQDASDAEFEEVSKRILELLFRLLAPYGLQGADAVHAVRGLRSLLHGFASLEAMGGFQMAEDLGESIIRAIRVYLRGLHPLGEQNARD